jgi:hypothetical protein
VVILFRHGAFNVKDSKEYRNESAHFIWGQSGVFPINTYTRKTGPEDKEKEVFFANGEEFIGFFIEYWRK